MTDRLSIFKSSQNSLQELVLLLQQISLEDYRELSPVLKTSSIGQHVRHIIELYTCLFEQYEEGIVDYSLRKRNIVIESDPLAAAELISEIININMIEKRTLKVVHHYDGSILRAESSVERELIYLLEHCVHHQAMIKLAVNSLSYITLDKNFGVARSTQEYRNLLENNN